MYKNRVMQHIFSEGMINQFLTSGNSLGIIQSNYFWDLEMSHLTLLIETDQMLNDEIDAKVKGNMLRLEVQLDTGPALITFEVELKSGFQYSILSCKAENPRQIKIIFEYRSHISNYYN